MNTSGKLEEGRAFGWALAIILIAVSYRVISGVFLPELPNYSPVMAIAFCAGLALPGVWAVAAPLAGLFLSDLALNAHFGVSLVGLHMIPTYACYLVAVGLGRALRGAGPLPIFGATVADSVLFYVVTNSLAWLHNPAYAQNAAGWVQSLTVGLPGYPPTWTFFRNSLVSDLLFTALFVGLLAWTRRSQAVPALRHQAS